MDAILVNVDSGIVEEVSVEPKLEKYYKILGCNLIDIAIRNIGGKPYSFIIDDEGLLKSNARVSAIDLSGKPMFVGNLLVIKPEPDEDGNDVGLDNDDIYHVLKNVVNVITMDEDGKNIRKAMILGNVEYCR